VKRTGPCHILPGPTLKRDQHLKNCDWILCAPKRLLKASPAVNSWASIGILTRCTSSIAALAGNSLHGLVVKTSSPKLCLRSLSPFTLYTRLPGWRSCWNRRRTWSIVKQILELPLADHCNPLSSTAYLRQLLTRSSFLKYI
jgi:hypothetical protein